MSEFNPNDYRQIGNVTLGCMSLEGRDLLDQIVESYEQHYDQAFNPEALKHPDDVYQAFYWLVRYSGLIQPADKQ